MANFSFHYTLEVKSLDNFTKHTFLVNCLQSFAYNHFADLGVLWNRVDILNLDDCLQVVLEQLNEVVLQLTSAEEFQDVFPNRRGFIFSKIRYQIAGQNLQSCRFTDAIGANESENLTWSGCGKSVELELVGPISVSELILQTLGQVDNLNGLEGASLHALTATDAQSLRKEANDWTWQHLDADMLACFIYWACLFALLIALLGLTPVWVDNGNSELAGFHIW